MQTHYLRKQLFCLPVFHGIVLSTGNNEIYSDSSRTITGMKEKYYIKVRTKDSRYI